MNRHPSPTDHRYSGSHQQYSGELERGTGKTHADTTHRTMADRGIAEGGLRTCLILMLLLANLIIMGLLAAIVAFIVRVTATTSFNGTNYYYLRVLGLTG